MEIDEAINLPSNQFAKIRDRAKYLVASRALVKSFHC